MVAYAIPTLSGFMAAAGAPLRPPLKSLVALDPALDHVLRLALGPRELDPIDAAVAEC
jgi:hypothetical protein